MRTPAPRLCAHRLATADTHVLRGKASWDATQAQTVLHMRFLPRGLFCHKKGEKLNRLHVHAHARASETRKTLTDRRTHNTSSTTGLVLCAVRTAYFATARPLCGFQFQGPLPINSLATNGYLLASQSPFTRPAPRRAAASRPPRSLGLSPACAAAPRLPPRQRTPRLAGASLASPRALVRRRWW